jgi:beta-phosphoglucomutase-like phosphatase (HAD superfamily)
MGRPETLAVTTAQPTPRASGLITAAYQTGRTVTIVSNNSGHAIGQYLAVHDLPAHVVRIIGRDDSDPERMMRPSPYRVREAVGVLDAQPGECAFVGDSRLMYSPDAWQASPSSATPTSPARPAS